MTAWRAAHAANPGDRRVIDAVTARPARPVRIVLADDDEDMRSLLRLLLDSSTGLEIIAEASDGEEALKVVAECDPDVALLDASMPILDGLQTLRRLRERYGRALSVVLWSGVVTPELRNHAVELGADRVLEKGADIEPLVEALRQVRAFAEAATRSDDPVIIPASPGQP